MSTMDPETSRRFGKAILEAAGASEEHVLADSISAEIDSGSSTARVSWESATTIPRERLAAILQEVGA